MTRLVAATGGEIRYNSAVEEIRVEKRVARGVRLAGGATIPADIVVSNADSASTYRNLLPSSGIAPTTMFVPPRSTPTMYWGRVLGMGVARENGRPRTPES